MASYTCPCCGKRYNGKRCANCYYERFTEEITHGLHTHEGEPLVIKEPERKPIPRKDPFACEKKRKKSPLAGRLTAVAAVVILMGALCNVYEAVARRGNPVYDFIPAPEPEAETCLAVPADGLLLYDAGGIRILADWQEDRPYGDGIPFYVQNDSDRTVTVYAGDVLVNGYLMEDAMLFCRAKAGAAAGDTLTLDPEELEIAGIEEVQELYVSLVGYDSETYETLLETEFMPLCTTPSLDQPIDDRGEVLFEQEGLRVICRGYVPSEYDPETLSEGYLRFFLENGTDQYVDCYTLDAFVNGESIPLSLWCDLPPHTRAIKDMYLYDLEELGLQTPEDVKDMTMSLEFCDHETYDLILQTDVLTVPFDRDGEQ